MKLASVFLPLLSLLSASALAAKKEDTYTSFRKQAIKSPNLKVTDATFDKLTALPRNHTALILLTALDARVGCQACHKFQPEFEVLSHSWTRGDSADESRVLFGTIDFANGKQTFQKLQLNAAPVLMLFPPTTGPNARADSSPLRYDFTTNLPNAEQIQAWLSRNLPEGPHPEIRRPINYVRIVVFTTLLLGGLTAVFVLYPYVWPILSNRNLWAGVSLVAVLLFTSGHMFNHIRGVPYIQPDGKGGIQYFTGGFQNQLGLESQIVAAIYGVLTFATISLALKVPRMSDPRSQQAAVFIWGAVMYGTYSFLLSVFRVKNGGYPFRLPPF